jgi:hypothetical protein
MDDTRLRCFIRIGDRFFDCCFAIGAEVSQGSLSRRPLAACRRARAALRDHLISLRVMVGLIE